MTDKLWVCDHADRCQARGEKTCIHRLPHKSLDGLACEEGQCSLLKVSVTCRSIKLSLDYVLGINLGR